MKIDQNMLYRMFRDGLTLYEKAGAVELMTAATRKKLDKLLQAENWEASRSDDAGRRNFWKWQLAIFEALTNSDEPAKNRAIAQAIADRVLTDPESSDNILTLDLSYLVESLRPWKIEMIAAAANFLLAYIGAREARKNGEAYAATTLIDAALESAIGAGVVAPGRSEFWRKLEAPILPVAERSEDIDDVIYARAAACVAGLIQAGDGYLGVAVALATAANLHKNNRDQTAASLANGAAETLSQAGLSIDLSHAVFVTAELLPNLTSKVEGFAGCVTITRKLIEQSETWDPYAAGILVMALANLGAHLVSASMSTQGFQALGVAVLEADKLPQTAADNGQTLPIVVMHAAAMANLQLADAIMAVASADSAVAAKHFEATVGWLERALARPDCNDDDEVLCLETLASVYVNWSGLEAGRSATAALAKALLTKKAFSSLAAAHRRRGSGMSLKSGELRVSLYLNLAIYVGSIAGERRGLISQYRAKIHLDRLMQQYVANEMEPPWRLKLKAAKLQGNLAAARSDLQGVVAGRSHVIKAIKMYEKVLEEATNEEDRNTAKVGLGAQRMNMAASYQRAPLIGLMWSTAVINLIEGGED